MPESPEALYARIVAQVGQDGRLPMPPVHEWDSFPWELVDGALQPKVVQPPLAEEAKRAGVRPGQCNLCTPDGFDDGEYGTKIWENWNFHVKRPRQPQGLPLILWLNANEHFDFTEMSDDIAAEYGKLCVWLSRIMSNLPHIGRVHVCRWGDGSEHMHTWFIARPERMPGIIGSMAIEWNEMLPAAPEDIWLADCQAVADRLAMHDGHVLPRPPKVPQQA